MLLGKNKRFSNSSINLEKGDSWFDFLCTGSYDATQRKVEPWSLKPLLNLSSACKPFLEKLIRDSPILNRAERKLLNSLQRHYPVLNLGPLVIITGCSQVKEALSNDEVFSVEKVYAERTNRDNGPFVLSLDKGELHSREKALLEAVMPASDLPKISTLCNDWIIQALSPYHEKGHLDVVQNFTRHVPYLFIKEYLGVPGPNDRIIKKWISDIFADIFTNIFNRKELAEKGETSGQVLMHYLSMHIDDLEYKLERGMVLPDTVLVRMIRSKKTHPWLNNDTIRRNISGLMVGTLETLSKATVKLLEALFQRPVTYAHVKSLVKSISKLEGEKHSLGEERMISRSTDTDHFDMLRRYIDELLRMNPHNPFLLRYCKASYEFQNANQKGNKRPRGRVGKDKWVLLSTYAAQQDPAFLVDPEEVDPMRDFEYLHYGEGLHRCQGARVNAVLLPKMISALVSLADLRPLPGPVGTLKYQGTFPTQWNCTFEVSNVS